MCYNKPNIITPNDSILLPVHSGAAISNLNLNIQRDDQLNGQPCDNISIKNESYGELTAMYWTWKNLRKLYPEVKYIGWSHYRRLFASDERKYFDDLIFRPEGEICKYKLNAEKIISIIESGKIIIPEERRFIIPLSRQYKHHHFSENYKMFRQVIKEKFHDYYDEFINFMEYNNKISLFCMFIMKYDDFVKYCEWIFSVMHEAEIVMQSKSEGIYQKRVFAYMAERLFNVYIRRNRIKTEKLNVYFYGGHVRTPEHRDRFTRFLSFIKGALKCCKINAEFWLLQPEPKWVNKLIKEFPER